MQLGSTDQTPVGIDSFCALACASLLLLSISPLPALAATPESNTSASEFNDELFWESDTDNVNEGQLEFHKAPDSGVAPTLENHYRLTQESLKTGWLAMQQCHFGLDPVPAIEIVYRYRGMKDLQVDSYTKMEAASVVGDRIELWQVQKGASVCASAKTKLLQKTDAGYQIRSGPYMRRFLDGYYPQRVILRIDYGQSNLAVTEIEPAEQPGLSVTNTKGILTLDAYFSGKLIFKISFAKQNQ